MASRIACFPLLPNQQIHAIQLWGSRYQFVKSGQYAAIARRDSGETPMSAYG